MSEYYSPFTIHSRDTLFTTEPISDTAYESNVIEAEVIDEVILGDLTKEATEF